MTGFHDVRFPLALSQGAKVTLQHASEIVRLSSGHEVRNARWSAALREWNIAGAITGAKRLSELMSFFEARRGNVHGFRFRDALDYSSGGDEPGADDQLLALGDGVQTVFQLIKTYGDTVRAITKPVEDSVRISIGGAETTDFSVDPLTGIVTLPNAPSAGDEILAGFLFDVPARFESETLRFALDACRAGRAPNIKIIEVRGI